MEKDLYLDLKNCTTDLERKHNQNVQEAVKKNQGDFLFTYTNEDHYEFDKVEVKVASLVSNKVLTVWSFLDCVQATKNDGRTRHQ